MLNFDVIVALPKKNHLHQLSQHHCQTSSTTSLESHRASLHAQSNQSLGVVNLDCKRLTLKNWCFPMSDEC